MSTEILDLREILDLILKLQASNNTEILLIVGGVAVFIIALICFIIGRLYFSGKRIG